MAKYSVTVSNTDIVVDTTTLNYTTSLSRVGGQGSKGDSISAVSFVDGQLEVDLTTSSGSPVETYSFDIFEGSSLVNLGDVDFFELQDKDVILYNAAEQNFTNHRFTTSSLTDVDNTNRQDGSMLVYSGVTSKYTATTIINNNNISIIGGDF